MALRHSLCRVSPLMFMPRPRRTHRTARRDTRRENRWRDHPGERILVLPTGQLEQSWAGKMKEFFTPSHGRRLAPSGSLDARVLTARPVIPLPSAVGRYLDLFDLLAWSRTALYPRRERRRGSPFQRRTGACARNRAGLELVEDVAGAQSSRTNGRAT
jgi:hypothetical protein